MNIFLLSKKVNKKKSKEVERERIIKKKKNKEKHII